MCLLHPIDAAAVRRAKLARDVVVRRRPQGYGGRDGTSTTRSELLNRARTYPLRYLHARRQPVARAPAFMDTCRPLREDAALAHRTHPGRRLCTYRRPASHCYAYDRRRVVWIFCGHPLDVLVRGQELARRSYKWRLGTCWPRASDEADTAATSSNGRTVQATNLKNVSGGRTLVGGRAGGSGE